MVDPGAVNDSVGDPHRKGRMRMGLGNPPKKPLWMVSRKLQPAKDPDSYSILQQICDRELQKGFDYNQDPRCFFFKWFLFLGIESPSNSVN